MNISCPSTFDTRSALQFVNLLENIRRSSTSGNLMIDFSNVRYVYPFPTIVIAQALRTIIFTREKNKLETAITGIGLGEAAIGYLKYFGFFKYIGFDIGNGVDHSLGGAKYLPITTIKSSQIMWKGHEMQQEIDLKADRLASVIFPGDENVGPAMMLSYSLREIMRNSFEHAGVDKCIAMGQRWYNGDAEIAIADEGCGIALALGKVMRLTSSEDAIRKALLPGITSGSVTGSGKWDNSGFGLYVVSELGKRYGEFSIVSSDCLLTSENGSMRAFNLPVVGTVVKLRVSTRDADYFPNILNQIVAEGEKISASVEGAVHSASKMSKTPVARKDS